MVEGILERPADSFGLQDWLDASRRQSERRFEFLNALAQDAKKVDRRSRKTSCWLARHSLFDLNVFGIGPNKISDVRLGKFMTRRQFRDTLPSSELEAASSIAHVLSLSLLS